MMANSKLTRVLHLLLASALLGACAGGGDSQPKGVPAEFTAGSWTLGPDEFARGQLDGLLLENGALHLAPDARQGTFVSEALDSGALLDTLALSAGMFSVPPAAFELMQIDARTSLQEQTWSPWAALSVDESDDSQDGDLALHGQIVPVTPGRYVQIRLIMQRDDARPAPSLGRISLDYVYAAGGPSVYQAKSAVTPAPPEAGAPRPAIIPRSGWGAKESLMKWKPAYCQPERVIVHHTVTPNEEENPAATVRAIYYFHAVTRGWNDIGYNYLIDWHGNIYEGRYGGEKVVGSHARGYNECSVGVALLGTYTQETISPAMREALVSLLAWIVTRYGIDPLGQSSVHGRVLPNILGHRAVANTNCPGSAFYPQLQDIRAEAAAVASLYSGLAAITATPAPAHSPPLPSPTPTAHASQTPTAGEATLPAPITPTQVISLPAAPPATPTPPPTAAPTPTPPARLVVAGLEVWPPLPAAGGPITLALHLANPGPADLNQVSAQVLFDAQTAAAGPHSIAWQLERLPAGQAARLVSPPQDSLGLEAGAHQLSVRAVARSQAGQLLADEWGPLDVSIAPAGQAGTGWQQAAQRWAIRLEQAWQAMQDLIDQTISAAP